MTIVTAAGDQPVARGPKELVAAAILDAVATLRAGTGVPTTVEDER